MTGQLRARPDACSDGSGRVFHVERLSCPRPGVRPRCQTPRSGPRRGRVRHLAPGSPALGVRLRCQTPRSWTPRSWPRPRDTSLAGESRVCGRARDGSGEWAPAPPWTTQRSLPPRPDADKPFHVEQHPAGTRPPRLSPPSTGHWHFAATHGREAGRPLGGARVRHDQSVQVADRSPAPPRPAARL